MKKLIKWFKLNFYLNRLDRLNGYFTELQALNDSCVPGSMGHFNAALSLSTCHADIEALKLKISQIKNGD